MQSNKEIVSWGYTTTTTKAFNILEERKYILMKDVKLFIDPDDYDELEGEIFTEGGICVMGEE